ncbi:Fructosamine kinase [Aspergillus sclerotialis]|uniref:Fructosamine kinase n=1 Tax=Aspergillus sclerotialis TaxID=2070753 RepID=A0A3A2Z8F1_9EURO|nr:Fructosamine kinase [Aspergillus sclerotialis]
MSVERYGNSAWASTARIMTRNSDGTLHYYFVKLSELPPGLSAGFIDMRSQIVTGELAGPRVLGEFSAMLELYKTMPSIVPTPRGPGKCLDSDDYFFLCDYVVIDHRQPDPVKLAERVAALHHISVSPTGQFGFHVTPYDGKLPLVAKWESNWVSFYRKLLEGVYKLDIQVNGHW